MVIIEHRLEDVLHRDVDRIVLMKSGRILADLPPDELLSTPLLRENGIREVEYSALAPKGYSAEIKNTGKYIIDFGDDLATKDFTGTGTFFTLVFQVKAGAMTGDYPITLTDFDVNDNYIDPVTVTGKAGKVKLVATLPATVTGALSGGSLKYTVTNAPEGARLVAARYDGGRMTASKVFTGALASGSVTLGSAGSSYKLMLIDSAGRPLCKAWCSE